MPNVRDRDGIFTADVYFWDARQAKRVRKQVSTGIKNDGTRQSRRNAERVARDIESSYVDGLCRKAGSTTLAKAFEKRIEQQILGQASESSISITNEKSVHSLAFFGPERAVHTILEEDLIEFANHGRKERAPATVTRELVELCCAIRAAGVEPPKIPNLGPGGVKELWFNNSDSAALISRLADSRREYAIVYRLLGLRLSELYRLEPVDVNITPGHVRVRGTKTRTDARGGADRTLPMHPEVGIILERRARVGGLLFPAHWGAGNGNRDLTEAARKAGLKFEGRVSFNVLRASFCTELVLAGVPLKKVAYLMGHKTTAMVERVYTRFFGTEVGADTVFRLGSLTTSNPDVCNNSVTTEQSSAHAEDAPRPEKQE